MPPDAPRIGAIGYIIISDDEVKFIGLGADASLAAKKPGRDEPEWFDLTMQWKDQLSQLAGEIKSGVAEVAPLKGRATCRYCGFASFCREPWSLSGSGAAEPDDPTATEAGSVA
jgi:ATP-dependent helicase/DNAse subunit B